MSNQLVLPGVGHVSDPGNADADAPSQASYRLPPGINSSQLKNKGRLFVAAAGIGAPAGDQHGSQMAAQLIQESYYRDSSPDIAESLRRAFAAANTAIFNKSGSVLFNTLSAAVVCAVVHGTALHVAHAGDSRAYLVGPRRIQRLTSDHVFVAEAESAEDNAAPKKLLTRSVGSMPTIEIEYDTFSLRADEYILLCTHGLTDVAGDEEIQSCVANNAPADAAQRLVELARQRGSQANITAVVVDPSALDTAKAPQPITATPIHLPLPIIAALVGGVALVVLFLAWNFMSRGSSASGVAIVATATPQTTATAVSLGPTLRATATAIPTLALNDAPTATNTPAEDTPTIPAPTPTPVPTSTPKLTATPTAAPTLIPVGSVWKYLDNGSDQGTAWRGPGFNDAAWASGPAQLGYGDGDEATVIGYGPDPKHKYITTYFRRAFTVTNASSYQALTLRLLRDDGAVVYLNGTEVFRSNMPAGTIDYKTLAAEAVTGEDESTFYSTSVNPSLLVNGTNVLAVEIHQSSADSSDISFELELTGGVSGSAPTPSATLTPAPGYTAIKLREPQNNQEVTGGSVTLEWETVKLQPGDRYEVWYKRAASANWEGKCGPVTDGQCVLGFERVPGYGSYVWAVVVVDANGAGVSPIKGANQLNWAPLRAEPTDKPKPCIPQPPNRC